MLKVLTDIVHSVMRKFAVSQSFIFYLENIEKPTVTTFQLTTRNLNILLCALPTLCTPVRVQHRLSFSTQIVRYRCTLGFLSAALRSILRSLGGYPAELLYTNGVLWVFLRVSQLNYIPVMKFFSGPDKLFLLSVTPIENFSLSISFSMS